MNNSLTGRTLRCQCYSHKRRLVDGKVCRVQATCIFTVLTPSIALLIFSGFWVYISNEEYNRIIKKDISLRRKILDIGKFIVALDTERSSTISFVTSRTPESQPSLRQNLDAARLSVDRNLLNIQSDWPTNDLTTSFGQTFRSPRLFNAVLYNHRLRVTNENRFWEELDFFTKAVEAMLNWMIRLSLGGDSPAEAREGLKERLFQADLQSKVPRWVVTHGYLMASLNYLGAEQALCNAFNSVVCFNRAESFTYANISFSGEATFHLFRLSYPEQWWQDPKTRRRTAAAGQQQKAFKFIDWKVMPHSSIFPELHECRLEVLSSAEYAGVGIDPSLCDYGRKNESDLREVDAVLHVELENLRELAEAEMESLERGGQEKVHASVAVTSCLSCYVAVVNCLKLVSLVRKHIKGSRTSAKAKKKKLSTAAAAAAAAATAATAAERGKSLPNPWGGRSGQPAWCGRQICQQQQQQHNILRKKIGSDGQCGNQTRIQQPLEDGSGCTIPGLDQERIFFKVTDVFSQSEVGSSVGLFSIFADSRNSSLASRQPSQEVLSSTSPLVANWHEQARSGSSRSHITLYPSLKVKD